MTTAQALHGFFGGFGIPAYVSTSVPDQTHIVLPYIVYTYIAGGFSGGSVHPTVQIWYKSESESAPNAKAKQIYDAIGEGILLKCDDGYIKLEHGTPWCVSANAQYDSTVKLRQLNITMTNYTM